MTSIPREQLEAEALRLPVQARARLAQRLIESLDEDAQDAPADVEQAWAAEIHDRVEEYRAGNAQPIPAADVFAQARRRPT